MQCRLQGYLVVSLFMGISEVFLCNVNEKLVRGGLARSAGREMRVNKSSLSEPFSV